MRPRKCILLVDQKEMRRSVTSCVLDVWRYHVIQVSNELEASAVFDDPEQHIDLIIGFTPSEESLLAGIAFRRTIPSLMVRAKTEADAACWCDRTLLQPPMYELIDTIKAMCRRKRGPRKGSKRKPVASVPLSAIFPEEVIAA